jgi:plastocyanin
MIIFLIGIAPLMWATRAHATPPSLTCDGSWTDDRAAPSPTITYPNYSPAEILIHPGQTVNWTSSTDTFSTDPLVDASGQLWGTFSFNEKSWPFTYVRSGSWEYYNGNNQTDAGIVCVTGPLAASFTPRPASPKPNQMVTFDGSGSSDHWATITDYQWDFGTGTFTDNTGSTATATKTFAKAGTYQVRLKVTDDGGYSQIATKKLTVGSALTKPPKLKSTTVRETSTGKAPIGVENPNTIAAKALVTLTQKVGTRTAKIGSAASTVPANGTRTLSVPLSSSARAYLARHPSLPAKAVVVLTANGTSKRGTFTITIEK